MSDDGPERYELRVAGPAVRQLDRLPEKVAAAIVEFMLGPLLDDPHRVGGALRRELESLHSARRGAYRVVYRIDEPAGLVTVLRIDHRSTIYRPH
ncbi:MAG: type II toxin-antitoxin system RelE family toxin [Ilumatobacteraceae bacterium]